MKNANKILSLILIAAVLCTTTVGFPQTAASDAALTSDLFDTYKDVGAYAAAKYTGGYDALTLGDQAEDLYAFGYLYTKLVNNRTDFNGYIYTIDEAKAVFGSDNQKVLAAEAAGLKYYAPGYDNSFRHEKDVEDANGVKKDAWYSAYYYRGDKNAQAVGGIGFGIKDGSRISTDDKELVIAFEYLDNGTDSITLQYVNTDWSEGNYTYNTYNLPRTGTNTWKTAVINVSNAKFAPESDTMRSAFCSGREDFVLKGNDIYISRVMAAKSSGIHNAVKVGDEPVSCPKTTINDPKSGRTYHFMHANGENAVQPYVTSQNWNNDGTKFVVGTSGDKMYEYDTVNETLRFLDFAYTSNNLNAFVTPDNHIYYIYNQRLYKINWNTYERSFVCMLPSGCNNISVLNVTNDGRYLTGYYDGTNIGARIVRLDTQTGEFDKKYDRKMYASGDVEIRLGHPMVNPEYPNIIFFCGEGIDTNYLHERMFIVDTNTDKMNMIYEQSYVDETYTGGAAGHEVWSMDGEYLYFVKYDLARTKGISYVGRIPFKNGVFTGEREIINGDASYWHCYPSGDNNWVAADTNTGEVYLMSTKNHNSYLIADFDMYTQDINHPYQPHPHVSYNGKSVNWQMVSDKNDGDSLGVGWADISDITMAQTYETQRYSIGRYGEVVSHTNTVSECEQVLISGDTDFSLKGEIFSLDYENEGNLFIVNNNVSDSYNENDVANEVEYIKQFVKAENGNSIYFDIDDEYLKTVHQQLKLKVTAYAQGADTLNIGYTSAVHDKYEWYKYEDMNVALDIDAGVNTYTVDLGYVNANNICKYASDLYFTAQSGTTYISDIVIEPYWDSAQINTYDEIIYSFAGGKSDYARGLDVYRNNAKMISVDDTDALEAEFGVTEAQAEEFKQSGFLYVTSSNDNAWNYKAATDVGGVTKNAWFSTRVKRVNTTSSHLDLPGYIYFNVTNDVIDKDDSELVVTIEYLDNRTDNFNFLYTTASGTAGHTITPANTGKWKTHSFVLTDASFSSTNKTLLASFTEDFRIEANKEDLYISKISIEKPGKKQLGNISVSSDGIISAAVTNKTAAASGATVFAAVFDKSGALQSVTPQSITIDAFGKQSISSAYGTADGKTAKLFVFEGNLKPYSSSDSLDVKVAFENGNANITWDEFVSDKDVSYKVYCDGGLVAVTDKTYYTCENVSSGSHIWQVEAVDFYGKHLN